MSEERLAAMIRKAWDEATIVSPGGVAISHPGPKQLAAALAPHVVLREELEQVGWAKQWDGYWITEGMAYAHPEYGFVPVFRFPSSEKETK